jgi:hypothetical protein
MSVALYAPGMALGQFVRFTLNNPDKRANDKEETFTDDIKQPISDNTSDVELR